MKKKTTYCEHCDDLVDSYTTKKVRRTVTVLGYTFETDYIEAYCSICGARINPNDVWAQNDLLVFDTYRRLKGLLTSEEIKAIRKKRGLTQVQLAQLIHCGEKNITRYETGTIQDKVFDLLIRLVDNDASYKVLKTMRLNDGKQQHSSKSN